MASKSKISLTAAAFMACTPGIAAALTFTQMKTTSGVIKGSPFTQTFEGFPAAVTTPGATLTSVSDTISESFNATINLMNIGQSTGSTTNLALDDLVTKTLAGAFVVSTSALGAPALNVTLNAGQSTSAAQSGAGSQAFTSSAATVLAAFSAATITGAGTTSLSRSGTVGFPNSETDIGTGTFTDVLVYTYTVTTGTTVPEPATLSLLGSGLVGLGLARLARRRRKR